jgi:UDP-N-acetylmuramate dehydrogenase
MVRLTPDTLVALERMCPGGVTTGEDLSQLSQWKIGGRADLVLRPGSAREVAALRRHFADLGLTPLVIGSTTNLLFSDAGLRVPCIRIGSRLAELEIDGCDVRVGAGYWVPFLARKLMQAGLTGLEHTCGIPGTLGGLIYMNGGSQREGIGSHVASVECVAHDGTIRIREQNELGFSYRHSVFHDVDEIITAVHLQLAPGDRATIRREMLEILYNRNRKFPRKLPNCGSTFVSDPALYADYGPPGALIEWLGFKGYRVGGAEVSDVHANFVVNTGNAKARDILTVVRDINTAVEEQTGRVLLAEVRYVRPDGSTEPASAAALRLEDVPT